MQKSPSAGAKQHPHSLTSSQSRAERSTHFRAMLEFYLGEGGRDELILWDVFCLLLLFVLFFSNFPYHSVNTFSVLFQVAFKRLERLASLQECSKSFFFALTKSCFFFYLPTLTPSLIPSVRGSTPGLFHNKKFICCLRLIE